MSELIDAALWQLPGRVQVSAADASLRSRIFAAQQALAFGTGPRSSLQLPTEPKPKQDLYEFNIGNHGTERTIEVTRIATRSVIARFDFEEDEDTASSDATRFAEGLAAVYYSGACIDLHGLLASDEVLNREYCWPTEYQNMSA